MSVIHLNAVYGVIWFLLKVKASYHPPPPRKLFPGPGKVASLTCSAARAGVDGFIPLVGA